MMKSRQEEVKPLPRHGEVLDMKCHREDTSFENFAAF